MPNSKSGRDDAQGSKYWKQELVEQDERLEELIDLPLDNQMLSENLQIGSQMHQDDH